MKLGKKFLALLREASTRWSKDNVPQMGAALAYYSLFSLAPLFLVAIAIAGLVFGEQAARGQIVAQLRDIVGSSTAGAIEELILRSRDYGSSVWTMLVSAISVLIGAMWVFSQLRQSLNTIWGVQPRPGNVLGEMVRDYLLSFAMVFGTGFLLLASLLLTTGLSALSQLMPASALAENIAAWRIVNGVVSFAVITLLFAMLFRQLPDVKIAWSDVWVGATFTALLFTAGKYPISLYLAYGSTMSPYGAAGSLVVVLLWVYYSALIVLFGAECTRVWADQYGTRLLPSDNAVAVTPRSSGAGSAMPPVCR